MEIYPKLIMDALATVRYPGTGKNIVEAGMVEDDLRISGLHVSFSLIFDKPTNPFLKSLVKASEAAIHAYVGKEVEVEIHTKTLQAPLSGGGATVARCEEYYRRVVRQRRCGEIYGSGQPGCGVVQVGLQSRLVGCRRVRTEHAQDVPCRGCASLCRIGGRP